MEICPVRDPATFASRPSRLIAFVIAMTLGGAMLVVGSASPAAATTTCKNYERDVGVQRVCRYTHQYSGARIEGSAYWWYAGGRVSEEGRLIFTVKDTLANNKCAYGRISNDYGGNAWYEVCGNKREKTFDRGIGHQAAGSPRDGYWRLQICSEKSVSKCSTVWSQKIGQRPPA
ncbi:hypothetical protein [Nocardioides sp.]|uniref:hypothetical protein n=1 Tax=Nocardioides sp. TaxID=35761 RepID=UPI0027267B49|nr:hypothetical protein [Nocardioides sp.]MDO9454912.1 hypothetical protein [Nocardioides sp.]